MPTFIATYDLRSSGNPYSEFIDQARKRPWNCWILSDRSEWYRLPNTTLVGTFATRSAAVASLEDVRAATEAEIGHKVYMDKWIIAEYSSAEFNSDQHQPKK